MKKIIILFFSAISYLTSEISLSREWYDSTIDFTDDLLWTCNHGIENDGRCPLIITFSPISTLISTFLTSYDAGSITSGNNKIIYKAKQDAASYVASNGKLHNAHLEQAFIILRKDYPNTPDMKLAKAILAY